MRKKTGKKVGKKLTRSQKTPIWKSVPVLSSICAFLLAFLCVIFLIILPHVGVLGSQTFSPAFYINVNDISKDGSVHKTYRYAVIAIKVDNLSAVAVKVPFNSVQMEKSQEIGIKNISPKSKVTVRIIALSNQTGTINVQLPNAKYAVANPVIALNMADITNSKSTHYDYCIYQGIPCQFNIKLASEHVCVAQYIDHAYCCGAGNRCQTYQNSDCSTTVRWVGKNVISCKPSPTSTPQQKYTCQYTCAGGGVCRAEGGKIVSGTCQSGICCKVTQ